MQIVDVRDQQCPAPLIATRRLLKVTAKGGSFEVITNSRNALSNISKFLEDNKTMFNVRDENSAWILTITKGGAEEPILNAEN
jgi:TusA-related sulfurtransferase